MWCYDGDGDLYCDLSKTQAVCSNAAMQPATPWRPLSTAACTDPKTCNDCNDANSTIHPNAFEACNGVDSNCSGTINDGCGCMNGTTISCGSAATCNQGAVQTCSNGQYGPCSQQPVPNAGADCGNGLGACANINSATEVCTGPSSGAALCTYKQGYKSTATYQTTPASPNNSYDWNCDGTATKEYTAASDFYYASGGGCSAVSSYNTLCGQAAVIPNGLPCVNGDHFLSCILSQFSACTFDQSCPTPGCGGNMTRVFCKVVSNTCVYDASKPVQSVKMPCE